MADDNQLGHNSNNETFVQQAANYLKMRYRTLTAQKDEKPFLNATIDMAIAYDLDDGSYQTLEMIEQIKQTAINQVLESDQAP